MLPNVTEGGGDGRCERAWIVEMGETSALQGLVWSMALIFRLVVLTGDDGRCEENGPRADTGWATCRENGISRSGMKEMIGLVEMND